jgi:DNA-binding XRE family transcriptional regulator
MRHRHLDPDPAAPTTALGLAALDDILERGDLDDWQPLLAEVRRDPWGVVADRVLHLVHHHPLTGTSQLWRSWIEELRAERPDPGAGSSLQALRQRRELTQRQVADRLGVSQPQVSQLERRRDIRLSTARAYVRALGGRLVLTAQFDDGDVPLSENPASSPTA